MAEVGAFEAKTNLAKYLDLAEAGEEVIITRRGRPVARLVGLTEDRRAVQADVLARMAALRAKLAARGVSITRDEIAEWRKEGRR